MKIIDKVLVWIEKMSNKLLAKSKAKELSKRLNRCITQMDRVLGGLACAGVNPYYENKVEDYAPGLYKGPILIASYNTNGYSSFFRRSSPVKK